MKIFTHEDYSFLGDSAKIRNRCSVRFLHFFHRLSCWQNKTLDLFKWTLRSCSDATISGLGAMAVVVSAILLLVSAVDYTDLGLLLFLLCW